VYFVTRKLSVSLCVLLLRRFMYMHNWPGATGNFSVTPGGP
jgi:hypothetical protein